jgi:hypothetical protein
VQFLVDEATSGATSLVLAGEASDDAAPFSTATRDVSRRAWASSTVAWTPVAWPAVGAAGDGQRTPDLAPVIQEIVRRPGWSAGHALAVIVTGAGKRVAKSYDGLPAGAALLHVDYLAP